MAGAWRCRRRPHGPGAPRRRRGSRSIPRPTPHPPARAGGWSAKRCMPAPYASRIRRAVRRWRSRARRQRTSPTCCASWKRTPPKLLEAAWPVPGDVVGGRTARGRLAADEARDPFPGQRRTRQALGAMPRAHIGVPIHSADRGRPIRRDGAHTPKGRERRRGATAEQRLEAHRVRRRRGAGRPRPMLIGGTCPAPAGGGREVAIGQHRHPQRPGEAIRLARAPAACTGRPPTLGPVAGQCRRGRDVGAPAGAHRPPASIRAPRPVPRPGKSLDIPQGPCIVPTRTWPLPTQPRPCRRCSCRRCRLNSPHKGSRPPRPKQRHLKWRGPP